MHTLEGCLYAVPTLVKLGQAEKSECQEAQFSIVSSLNLTRLQRVVQFSGCSGGTVYTRLVM